MNATLGYKKPTVGELSNNLQCTADRRLTSSSLG